MLDIKYIRENKQTVQKSLEKRLDPKLFNLDKLLQLDQNKRQLIVEIETLKAVKNKHSKSKPQAKTIAEIKEINNKLKKLEAAYADLNENYLEMLSTLPNIVLDDVAAGDKENNETIYTYLSKPEFDFETKDHVNLATSLNLIDYQRGVKIAGSGFWVYKDIGAQLEWALLNYFTDYHLKNNYQFILPPLMLSEKSAYTSGHLPKFKDDLFWTQDKLCLNATSEMMLGNYHRDEILNLKDLPLKYFAYSPCFRREAGAYREEERGMIRGHQFNKVEMFVFCQASDSEKMFEELLNRAKDLMEGLELHYQISKLAAGDCSYAMAKTYDLEVWLPSMGIYKEVSSVSNALDYQARRGKIRYEDEKNNKSYVHTLNASGLATSRLLPAILEQNQLKNGSVKVPKVLQKYLNKEIIELCQ
jgi:seryl-tRNA synthetase